MAWGMLGGGVTAPHGGVGVLGQERDSGKSCGMSASGGAGHWKGEGC